MKKMALNQVKEIVSFYNFTIYNLKVFSRTFSSNYDKASYPTIKMHVCVCPHTHTHTHEVFLRETKIAKSYKTCKMDKKDKRMKGFRNRKLEKRNNESFAQIMMVKRIMEGNKYYYFLKL
jgi:hypothetical protein